MARVQGWEESRGWVFNSKSISVQWGGQGLGTVAHVLVVFGLDLGALGELETNPLTGLWLAHRGVFFARFRGGPWDGPVLFSLAPCGKNVKETCQNTCHPRRQTQQYFILKAQFLLTSESKLVFCCISLPTDCQS